KQCPLEEKAAGMLPFLTRVKLIVDPVDEATRNKIRQIVAAVGDRLRVFSDILLHAPPFLKRDPDYDQKAVDKKLKKDGAAAVLASFKVALAETQPYEPAALEQARNLHCDQGGIKKNVLVHALRVAGTRSQ